MQDLKKKKGLRREGSNRRAFSKAMSFFVFQTHLSSLIYIDMCTYMKIYTGIYVETI